LLEEALDAAEHPTQDLNIHSFGEDAVEIEAVLASTSVDGEQLDALVAQLATAECIVQAFWSPSTTD